ncbi:MAG: hypothetical protein BJ554DRAFT_4184 [Olpidium bornovanus]|uniref:Uncharacterized protein n=1 Tax=Olpidium bornovanus TaxID=278681 RepID=A0A8H8DFE6_9FUNG|nr:MAG: hypothetical protein BJ554DRAFT_4184 [Olpidium bornovanus]
MAEQNGAGAGPGDSLSPAAAAPTLDVQQPASTSASQVAFAEQKKPERPAPASLPLTRVPTSDRPKEGGSGKGKAGEQAVAMVCGLIVPR